MQWVVDPVVALGGLASHNQQRVVLAVVYEAMANAGPTGEGCEVSGLHRVKRAVYPRIDVAFENVHELFLFLLGVRP